jgi:hypothetical protein
MRNDIKTISPIPEQKDNSESYEKINSASISDIELPDIAPIATVLVLEPKKEETKY